MTEETILAAIGSTERTSFSDFCDALGNDIPREKAEWRELFGIVRTLVAQGFVELDQEGRNIESMILTPAGANRIRDKLDSRRGLLKFGESFKG